MCKYVQSVDSSCLSTPPTATGIVASRLGFRVALHDVRAYDLDIRSVLPCPLLLPLLLMLLLLILKLALLVLVLALALVLYKLRVLEVVVVVVVVVVVAAVVLLLLLLLQLLLLLLPILHFSNSGREPRNARTTGPAKVDKSSWPEIRLQIPRFSTRAQVARHRAFSSRPLGSE